MRRAVLVLALILPLVIVGCGGSEGGDTGFPTFRTDPANAPIAGLGSRDGKAVALTVGGTRLDFIDSQRSLTITVSAGVALPTTLTVGTTSGLSARADVATGEAAPIGWVAKSGTVRLSRAGSQILAEIGAAFVPDHSVNTLIATNISPGFRVRGVGEAE